ncbi:DUF2232 domain-containing protein [candidate division KSB3 bacterium]|uniref:DUF2232 domain-containing protein n=1 Tax=candidate division KSB3 bacterium TaxID=2044937 RepID=A0A9D5K1N2_9BACT|nr:DUF2232 domain-containing protein [candidate division KSB3 bacterium]MBD3327592.1 DUF2232 domain-containing protein [candidate division KSB3 bacterium]
MMAGPNGQSPILHYLSVVIAVISLTIVFPIVQQAHVTSLWQFLLPLPIIYVTVRHSLWSGVGTIGLTTISIALLSGYRLGGFFFFGTGITAGIVALCFRKACSATATISYTTLYYLLLSVASVYLYQGITYDTYTHSLQQMFKTQFLTLYEEANGVSQHVEAQLEAIAHVMSMTFPLISALSSAALVYVVTRISLKVLKIPVPPLARVQNWSVSDYLVWVFILGGLLYHLPPTRILGINIILGLVFLYYLGGCAIITYFLKQKQAAKVLQLIAYVLLFLQIPYIFVSLGLLLTGYTEHGVFLPLPAIVLVAGLGLANVWFDFRKRFSQ